MAPLFRSFARNQRTAVSTLFALTFLGSVAIVAVPCPAASRRVAGLSSDQEPAPGGGQRQPPLSQLERAERARRKFGFLEEGRK